MKDRKRALRRHHRERMTQHALRSYVLWWGRSEDKKERRKRAMLWRDNLKKCSCYMCGNPRKFEGRLTTQERRLHEAAQYELTGFADLLRHH